jgi:ABC-2 type transport system permease protein
MNRIHQLLLKLALLPAPLYRKAGVHLPHLTAILKAKLIMDDRRPNSFFQQQQNKQKEEVKNSGLSTIFVSAFLGLLLLLAFAYGTDYTSKLTLFFSFYIFMLAGTLITDFTSVLIDVKDNYILLPKPVNDTTVVLSRLLHIFLYLSKIAFPMSIPALIWVGVDKGIAGALLLLPLLVTATVFSVFVVNGVYLLLLQMTSPQRFKQLITYFQIFFAVALYASYQVIPRLFSRLEGSELNISHLRWIWSLPSFWLGHAWESIYQLETGAGNVLAIVLSTMVPLLLVFAVIRFLAPSFNRKIALLSAGSETIAAPKNRNTSASRSLLLRSTSRLFCRNHTEQAAYVFSWTMMARSREFQLKVYPSIGYLGVFLFILFFNSRTTSLSEFQTNLAVKKFTFITLAYLSYILLSAALQSLKVSEKYKAGWIWLIAPVPAPGLLITGGLKAAIVRFSLPLMLFLTTLCVAFWGVSILPNLLLAFANQLLLATLYVWFFLRSFPFSVAPQAGSESNTFVKGILLVLMMMALAGLHYLVFDYTMAVGIAAIVATVIFWLLLRRLQQKGWEYVGRGADLP